MAFGKKLNNKIWTGISLVILVFLWWVISKFLSPILFPSPFKVFDTLIISLFKKDIWIDILNTVYIWVIGTFFGIVLGIFFGIIIGYKDILYHLFEFPVDFFKSLPSLMLYPLFLILFGLSITTKVAIITFGCFFYMVINTMYGIKNSKKSYEEVSSVYKISGSKKFFKILLPSALPDIFIGIRLAVSIGLILAVGSELILGTKYGIGRMVLNSLLTYNMPLLYVAILITGVLGYSVSKSVVGIENKILHWRGR